MKYVIRYIEDTDEMRKLHKMAFGGDPWPGDDHEFWIAKDSSGSVAGFASAIFLSLAVVYLSRAAVARKHVGNGLHSRMIKTRMKWAHEHGAKLVVTHVDKHNYASMINLLNEGFKFATTRPGWQDYHLMYHGDATEEQVDLAIDLMDEEINASET